MARKDFSKLLVMLSHVVCPQRVCVCVRMNIACLVWSGHETSA